MVAKNSFILVGYLFLAGQDVAGLFADDIHILSAHVRIYCLVLSASFVLAKRFAVFYKV